MIKVPFALHMNMSFIYAFLANERGDTIFEIIFEIGFEETHSISVNVSISSSSLSTDVIIAHAYKLTPYIKCFI